MWVPQEAQKNSPSSSPARNPASQKVAAGRDPPATVTASHDQCADSLLAHPDARALRSLVGADRHGSRHVIADGTPREGIREIAPDADDPYWKTPLRDHQVLNPKGGGDPEGFSNGTVRGDSHRLVTHDISNTHTAPLKDCDSDSD